MEEDHRTKLRTICGAIEFDIAGREWICVKAPHAKVYERKAHKNKGQIIFENNPTVDAHYMVLRWPNRDMKD